MRLINVHGRPWEVVFEGSDGGVVEEDHGTGSRYAAGVEEWCYLRDVRGGVLVLESREAVDYLPGALLGGAESIIARLLV